MKTSLKQVVIATTMTVFLYGCSSGSDDSPQPVQGPATGSVSISLTDSPWEDVREMVLHITDVEMGHADGSIVAVGLSGGPLSIDMMQLQNGELQMLVDGVEVPMGRYEWIRFTVDGSQSHIDLASTGGRHGMQMGSDASDGLEVHEPFEIFQSMHSEFMIDFDIRRGVQHHDHGMMGDEYQLHSAMRLVDLAESGGLTGIVHASMIDVNHPDCSDEPGGNWAYLFHGDAVEPDDIAEPESDSMPGPIAADRIDMDATTGEHHYYFGYLSPGTYRVAMTCSGEWDEVGDDDHPSDPDSQFTFQMFSEPMEVVAGQMHHGDLVP